MKLREWIVCIVFIGIPLFFFGIGAYGSETHLLGDKGSLPTIFAFMLLIYTFFCIWAVWNVPIFQSWDMGLRPGVWGAIVILILIMYACVITFTMGPSYYECNNEYCYSLNGKKTSSDTGKHTEIEAPNKKFIGKIVCPICGETNMITGNFWKF